MTDRDEIEELEQEIAHVRAMLQRLPSDPYGDGGLGARLEMLIRELGALRGRGHQ